MSEVSVHDDHKSLPGYSPGQLLHKGCALCDLRAAELTCGLEHMDPVRFAYAWDRAARYGKDGIRGVGNVNPAEVPVLEMLFAVQRKLETRGIPIGLLPDAGWLGL